ncbi:fatty acid--CoA ligase family protein [bacterium]|nr:fatty acid--CoA ligase family protein [bacterium]
MDIINSLQRRWGGISKPFLVHPLGTLKFSDLMDVKEINLSEVKAGEVVALIGDFDPGSILTLLRLIEMKAIIVPLTKATETQHEYFFDAATVDVVIEGGKIRRLAGARKNDLLEKLRKIGHAGLVLFSTGTTGRPKAILHDLNLFLDRFETPRPTLKTINFLLFDHIGGLNTLLHTLYNKGTVVVPVNRRVETILNACKQHAVEVLPTTPTFLRLMLLSGLLPHKFPASVKIVTYGTERMDQPTLDSLCELLPDVDFRQTFGMSELGIVRVKSRSRNSLFMKIGGEGIETRVVDNVLEIRSKNKMLGYLNAESPFDAAGWYNTNDVVVEDNGYYQIVGRINEVVNVAGEKFMASEVEMVAMDFVGVQLVKASAVSNPITGQHVELTVQVENDTSFEYQGFKKFLKEKLPKHMVPKRLHLKQIAIGHRFKKA